jgi:hypothetical protein
MQREYLLMQSWARLKVWQRWIWPAGSQVYDLWVSGERNADNQYALHVIWPYLFQHNRKGWVIPPQLDLKHLRRGKPDISWLIYSGIWRNSGIYLPNIRHHIPGDFIFKAGAVNISNSPQWFLMGIIFSRMACWLWDSHSCGYDGYYFLGYVTPCSTVLDGVTALQMAYCYCRQAVPIRAHKHASVSQY